MKKFLALLLVLLMLPAVVPSARAAHGSRDLRPCLDAFRGYLNDHRSSMESLESQHRETDYMDHGSLYFDDLTGDGLPELLACRAMDGETADLTAGFLLEVEVLGYRNGGLEVLAEVPDIPVGIGGGTDYILFRLKNSDDLLLALLGTDGLFFCRSFYRLSVSGSRIRADRELELVTDFSMEVSCRYRGQEITESQYSQREQELAEQLAGCIFSNSSGSWYESTDIFRSRARNMMDEALTAEQAEDYLQLQETRLLPGLSPAREAEFWKTLGGRTYTFASGAGAWFDDLTLHPDGSFEGTYMDDNMGEEDPGLGTQATRYYCGYRGRFTNLRRLDVHSYAADLEVTLNETPGQIRVSPQEPEVRLITTGLSGLMKTDTVIIYTPGQRYDEAPEDLSYGFYAFGEAREVLDTVAIFNPRTGSAFFTMECPEKIPGKREPVTIQRYGTSAVVDEDLFAADPTDFDPNLAKLCAILSTAAEKSPKDLTDTLEEMQMDAVTCCNLEHDQNLGCAVAHTTMFLNGRDTTVLFIVARGSVTDEEFFLDAFTYNAMFSDKYRSYSVVTLFQEQLARVLQSHADAHHLNLRETPLQIVVTGHSLGGAAANLMGADLFLNSRKWGDIGYENLSVYTFGSIDSLRKGGDISLPVMANFEAFHNVYNEQDTFGPNGRLIATARGNSGVGRFGHLDLFSLDLETSPTGSANHNMECYLQALNQDLVVHEMYQDRVPTWVTDMQDGLDSFREGAKQTFLSWDISCPVDVEVLREGQVVGGIRDEASYVLDDSVPMVLWAMDGDKHISAPDDCTLRIEAYGEGTMTVAVTGTDADGNEVREAVYENVPLQEGQIFLAADAPEGEALLKTEQGRAVRPDGSTSQPTVWILAGIGAGVLALLILLICLLCTRKKRRRKGKFSK